MANIVYPATIVIVHAKENREKCSLAPLRQRPDLRFVPFLANQVSEALPGYVRLSLEGPPLSTADGGQGLLVIDGTWRHVARVHERFSHVPARSLSGYSTAYPRVSKLFRDPAEGLASVKALYIAYRILGRPTDGLLDGYFWREQFLELNGWS